MSNHKRKPDEDRAIEQRLRTLYKRCDPPPELWERITDSARDNTPGQSSSVRFRSFIALAVVALVTIATVLVTFNADTSMASYRQALIEDLHTFDVSGRALDISDGNPIQIQRWFSARMEFRPPLPPATEQPVRLIGGRLCQIMARRLISYMYDVAGTPVSLYISNENTVLVDADSDGVARLRGYGHISWRLSDMQYTLVSALPDETLVELANSFRRSVEQQLRGDFQGSESI